MARLSELTSRDAVLQTIAECDRLGREAFLARYSYGPARAYYLLHDGCHYDSKAIVGVAWGKQHGTPLECTDFSGGFQTVQRALERLGFELETSQVIREGSSSLSPSGILPKSSFRAWLMLAAGENRQHAGNHGYDDEAASHYSWDSTVANHAMPKPGDIIAIWDKKRLLGFSVIERIDRGHTTKPRLRCPKCETTAIKKRKTTRPWYRCASATGCRHEFDKPKKERVHVQTYVSHHAAAWVDLEDDVLAPALRAACVHPRSIQSLRELKWNKLHKHLGGAAGTGPEALVSAARSVVASGHAKRVVRVRRGQRVFRQKLLAKYGEKCALSGPCPKAALDAAHLYSYAKQGVHDTAGGLLIRKDLHRLFDLGLLVVAPKGLTLDVHPSLKKFPVYYDLHGTKITVKATKATRAWLERHWAQYRSET